MNSPVSPSDSASNQQVQIFPPPSGGIGVLALSPFYITNHKPQPNGAMGVNVAMANSDLSGLLAWILPYVKMSIGDVVHIFLEPHPLPVAEITVRAEHFNDQGEAQPISFYISLDDLEFSFAPNSLTSLEGKIVVERISGNSEESPPVGVLYKYPPPGPQDPDASTAKNEAMTKPIVADLVLDQTVIDNGTWVRILQYPNQCIGDMVTTAFGPLLASAEVTVIGDVSIEITAAMLATLKPTDNLPVSWSVHDIVENFSKWSLSIPLKVIPGISLLAAPFWDEADTENVLSHDLLQDSDTTVTATAIFAAQDRIDLSVEGHTKTGEAIIYTDSRTRTTAGRTQIFDIPNELIRNAIGGELRASFTVTKGNATQQSKPADAIITGRSQPLGLPTVTPLTAAGEVPEDAPTVTVEFAKYWPLKPGAAALCYWQALSEAGTAVLYIFQQLITDEKLPIIFQIENKFVAPYAGGPLSVKCEIKNPGEAAVSSDLLQLQISAKKVITINPPTQVPKGTIDPLDGEWLMRAEYLEAQEGQMGRLRQENAPAGASPFPRLPFNKNKRINWPLERDFLIRHQGEEIKLLWNLWSNGERIASSPTTKVVIAAVQSEDPRFPTITVAGVTTSELDVKSLKPTDMLKVPAWFLQALGQLVWLTLEGIDASGNKVVLEFVVSERVTSVDGYEKLIPLEWFQALKHLSEATVSFSVSFSGLPDEKSKVKFPTRKYLIKSTLPLSMNTTPMTLSGLSVKYPWPVTGNASIGNTDTRYPVGGTGPYIFISDRPGIASVTSAGIVTGNANGTATITVTDQDGNSLSFTVYVSNVYRLAINENSMNYQQAVNWMYSLGGSPVPYTAINDLLRVYGRMPIYKHYWLCEKGGCQNISVGFAFFHHEYRAIYCADAAAAYSGAWCLLRT
ncbi:Ig-like domain-containing protein [Pseudomonas sp. UV AK001]|uniref:Ig-like domain-containing protein n=1 Tax=Pseudomonas sp. UV AK001 TaxID=3384791 RepID=UPI0038D50248